MIISLDTEATGLDLAHGAKPFLVTWCEEGLNPSYVEWLVDPHTRQPQIPMEDLEYIAELLDAAELIYLHNAKYDARALATVGVELPWPKVRDTLVASHLLATNRPHNLTWLCIEYLGKNIEPLELNIKRVTQACRTIAKRDFPSWRIADEGLPDMPSVRRSSKRDEDKPWKNDMWLPQALANHMVTGGLCHEGEVDEDWLNACARYACGDSEHTLYLGLEMERLLRDRGLWAIYEHRLHLPRVDCEMESYGLTARGDHTAATIAEYERHVAESRAALVSMASEFGHELELAEGAALNDNMRDFFYGAVHQTCTRCKHFKRVKHWNGEQPAEGMCPKCAGRKRTPALVPLATSRRDNLRLPVVISGKTHNATLHKDAMQEYIQTLDEGPALDFVELLTDERMYEIALGYIHQYRRYWVPVKGSPGYYRIHASFNPCGTNHLRQSSNSPNLQNVSSDSKELSNRACFGPLPSREWWRMDFKSIENRIPPYECGEPKMIEVFEKPDDPPYWGSLYYIAASVLYPDEFWSCSQHSPDHPEGFKKKYPLLYKRAKFFLLAKQYGAGRAKGDLLSKVKNSYDRVDNEFPLLAALQAKYLDMAERIGYVETLPDRTVDPTRGYPILASRTEDGRVLSTTPFNYHVSGTACWCKNTALIRCSDQCAEWRAEGFDAHVALEVHDELLFDFPRGATPEENLPRALTLKKLMEISGDNLVPAIPTPVSISYHTESWAKETPVCY